MATEDRNRRTCRYCGQPEDEHCDYFKPQIVLYELQAAECEASR